MTGTPHSERMFKLLAASVHVATSLCNFQTYVERGTLDTSVFRSESPVDYSHPMYPGWRFSHWHSPEYDHPTYQASVRAKMSDGFRAHLRVWIHDNMVNMESELLPPEETQ